MAAITTENTVAITAISSLRFTVVGVGWLIGVTGAAELTEDFPICRESYRTLCISDGDTLWDCGEKFRLKEIDAPEIDSRHG